MCLFLLSPVGACERYETSRDVEEQVVGDELCQPADLDYQVRHGECLVQDRRLAQEFIGDTHHCLPTHLGVQRYHPAYIGTPSSGA